MPSPCLSLDQLKAYQAQLLAEQRQARATLHALDGALQAVAKLIADAEAGAPPALALVPDAKEA